MRNFVTQKSISCFLLELLIENVIRKKQLKGIDEKFVRKIVESYFLTYGNFRKVLERESLRRGEDVVSSKVFRVSVKEIRKKLGSVYGQFLTSGFSKKDVVLKNAACVESVLFLHKSTRERMSFYEEIYVNLGCEFECVNSISDLGCGLNPLSFLVLEKVLGRRIKVEARDINFNDMKFLNSCFEKFGISGNAKVLDLTDVEGVKSDFLIQNCDVCFLFKVLDSLETFKKNISKLLLTNISCSIIVVSFSCVSLVSKVNISYLRRNWFFSFLVKTGWNFRTFEVGNELFVVIRKQKLIN